MSVDSSVAGKCYGHLVTEYADYTGHRIACRCRCRRLVFIAAADLTAGVITSCGCQPASAAHHNQLIELLRQQRREITFSIARART